MSIVTKNRSLLESSDCYKFSHPFMVGFDVESLTSYIEPRKGEGIVFFGLQAFIREYLSKPITMEDIDRAERRARSAMIPFHRALWEYIVNYHNGFIPVTIEALPEGTVVDGGIPVVQVTSKCKYPAIGAAIETALLRGVWYPSQVATISRRIKILCKKFLEETSDSLASLPTMLNDFGARGCSSGETAALGGMSHLVNFIGSDTFEAIDAAEIFYDHSLDRDGPVLVSVPATEHSVTTIHGVEGESNFIGNVIDTFTNMGFSIISNVADSYDLDNFVINIVGRNHKQKIEDRDGCIVVRPDSGTPWEIVPRVVKMLEAQFGTTLNSKGYKVLNPKVRVIQGDGVEYQSIEKILTALKDDGYSAENVVFGMGGKLLQAPQRDDSSWAMKTNEAIINGKVVSVQKKPKTDMSKASKGGKQAVVEINGKLVAIPAANLPTPDTGGHGVRNWLEPVWDCGKVIRTQTFAEVRKNAELK